MTNTAIQAYEPGNHPATEAQPNALMTLIERIAMDPNAPMDRLDRLLDMKERVEKDEARKAFEAAMAAAKADIKPIIKTATVDYTSQKGRTHYQHETLDGIARQVDPILASHGLSYRFRATEDGDRLFVTCIVSHAQGHREETTLSGPLDQSGQKNAHQAKGSAATYLQRYTLKLALGLAAAKDDDAQAAAPSRETVTAEEYQTLRERIEADGIPEADFCSYFGVEDLHEFPRDQIRAANFMLKARRLEREKAQERAE